MTDPTAWPPLNQALTALQDAARGLGPDDLLRPTPCAEWTVGQVLEHAALDQFAWAKTISGGAVVGVEADPFSPTGEPGERVLDLVAQAVTAAGTAWSGIETAGGSVPTPLPQGPMDVDAAAAACALDAGVHAWDVAVALGRPSPLTDELAAAIAPTAHAIVEPLRQWGVYAAELAGEGAAAESLLRYLGRDPQWTT